MTFPELEAALDAGTLETKLWFSPEPTLWAPCRRTAPNNAIGIPFYVKLGAGMRQYGLVTPHHDLTEFRIREPQK